MRPPTTIGGVGVCTGRGIACTPSNETYGPLYDGFGCVLLHGSGEPYLLKSDIDALKRPKEPPLLAEIAGPGKPG